MQGFNSQISSRLNFNYLKKTLADDSFGDGFPALADMYKCKTESIESSATSKRRIDMLFGETKSVNSEYQINHRYNLDLDYQLRKVKSVIEGEIDGSEDYNTYYQEQQQEPPNDIQIQIKNLFSEISSSEQETNQQQNSNNNIFFVQHLGCIPVQNKIISVNGLQEPLKNLFLKYQRQCKKNTTGCIKIGNKGLQIEYNSNYGGKIEKLYPFSNIAVWASLKFVHRLNNDQQYEYAFVPIITDSDKNPLFTTLDQELVDQFVNNDNIPIFTIIIRESDKLIKQLLCYGFICESSEDAVIVAATLYRVLMNKIGKNQGKNKIHRRHPNKHAYRLCSIKEISSNEFTEPKDNNYARLQKKQPTESTSILPPPPKRPPRRMKQPTISHKVDEDTGRPTGEGRDILTKIAISRNGSFLNTKRLGFRYADSKPADNEPVIQNRAPSPFDFVEMFNELQSQEGLKTIDEILRVIIKRDGMSYNELKPIYKEFLLKLALVLSKDELYNLSRAIMKSQQKKNKSPSSRLRKAVTTKSGLKNIFHTPLSKLKIRKNKSGGSTYVTSTPNMKKLHNDRDGTSTHSFMLSNKPKQPDLKSRIPPNKKNNNHAASIRQKTTRFHSQGITSTSEDSDYSNTDQRKFTSKLQEDALRPSSSGYFSFSECSYDTETCTCVSAVKCYCSLSKNKLSQNKSVNNYSICSCDTLKCRKRNKCYCLKPKQSHQLLNKLSLVEQLKRKGFAVSESSLSPDNTKKLTTEDTSNTKLSKSLEYLENSLQSHKNRMEFYDVGYTAFPCRHSYQYSSSHSSKSSKASQKRSVSSDNLGVDYSMFAKPDERTGRENIAGKFSYCNSEQISSHKQNIIYTELARSKLGTHNSVYFDENYSASLRLQMETPSMLTVCPYTHIRTCSYACLCQLHAEESLPTCKKIYGLTPFHEINMENIFGYFP